MHFCVSVKLLEIALLNSLALQSISVICRHLREFFLGEILSLSPIDLPPPCHESSLKEAVSQKNSLTVSKWARILNEVLGGNNRKKRKRKCLL